MAATDTETAGLERLLAAKEIVVVCGPGGVGKTTVAAAAGLMAATQLGGRVLVLTVDPARRLATSMGIGSIGNIETRVPDDAFAAAGLAPRGELWVAMLDMKASWDDLVRQHAPDIEVRDAILSNQLYENITGKFVQSHDYIAMERLHEIHASGRYDLIIVDTPPSRHAIDFLEAPRRMGDFFSSRLLRWLTVPYRSKLMTAASRPFYTVADRVLGARFLHDIADFFVLFQTMHSGFVQRARAVQRTIEDWRTTFLVVSTLEPGPVLEAGYLLEQLDRRKLLPGGLVFNRVLPGYLRNRDAEKAARRMVRDSDELAALLPADLGERQAVSSVLKEIGGSFLDYRVPATREAEVRDEMVGVPDVVVPVPFLETDVHDLVSLARVGEQLWSPGASSRGAS